ncbi:MAG: DUF2452 domain-containing protein [Saprospiraceae bacterium]|nr:DUF2452 domain-containing protein [Saprospiraceae bacterium]MBP7699743.1 DUF2452 domain-containing protein [Saprospiraceae bacterium]
MKQKNKKFHNPIDADKITETPNSLTYGHHRGSAVVKPLDKGRIKGLAMDAMYEQTDIQLLQIKQQAELLMEQARIIQERKAVSELVYKAEMAFKPIINHIYHLYQKNDNTLLLSLIAPDEWARSQPFQFKATVRLLADHTWDVLVSNMSN